MNSLTVLDWTATMVPAQSELTDSEILDKFGSLLCDAFDAFREDPSYIVEMAESAAMLKAKREQRAIRRAS